MMVFTIGGYGNTKESFFQKLTDNNIDLLIDIRQRRGMRGKTYSFLNSSKLISSLESIGISYTHMKHLAPPESVRILQKQADIELNNSKRSRESLSARFISAYTEDVLRKTTAQSVIEEVRNFKRICFFCVESTPCACHRSIVSTWLEQVSGSASIHI